MNDVAAVWKESTKGTQESAPIFRCQARTYTWCPFPPKAPWTLPQRQRPRP